MSSNTAEDLTPIAASRSTVLDTFAAALKELPHLSPQEAAVRGAEILELVLQTEAGGVLAAFEERFCVEPPIAELMRSVLKAECVSAKPHEFITYLHAFFNWYRARVKSLEFLTPLPAHDTLFMFRIVHDRSYGGVPGCELRAGVFLIGRRGERMWLRGRVRLHDQYIKVRPEWGLWVDETDHRVQGENNSILSVLLPLRLSRQQAVIDEAALFLPYDALDLPPGRVEGLEFELELLDGGGKCVTCATTATKIQIAPAAQRSTPIPSPQALVLWPKDVVTGTALGRSSVEQVSRTVRGNVQPFLFVQTEVESGFLDHLPSTFEFRVTNEQGGELSTLRQESRGPGEVAFELPIADLDLDPGEHRLRAEMILVEAQGGDAIGTLVPITVTVPAERDEVSKDSSEPARAEMSHEIELLPVFQGGILRLSYQLRLGGSATGPLLLQIEMVDEEGEPLRDARSAPRPNLSYDAVHELSSRGVLVFQRLIEGINGARVLTGELRIELERCAVDLESRWVSLCLSLFTVTGEEVAFRRIEIPAVRFFSGTKKFLWPLKHGLKKVIGTAERP